MNSQELQTAVGWLELSVEQTEGILSEGCGLGAGRGNNDRGTPGHLGVPNAFSDL